MKSDRHQITPAVFLLLIKDNKILLTRRINTGWMDGKYTMPSGRVEIHESPRQAMIRETFEEIGIVIKEEDLQFEHVSFRNSDGEDRVDVYFTVSDYSGEVENKEPDLCDEVEWFDMNNLPDNTIEFLKDIIKNYQNKVVYSEIEY